jgi:hypothetical protein
VPSPLLIHPWETITLKNPGNFDIKLRYPAWATSVSDDEIIMITSKGSLILNTTSYQIMNSANFKAKDHFYDGIYENGDYVYAFGKEGIHVYLPYL